MGGIRDYFGDIGSALSTTVKGMGVTLRHFRKEPPITVQYPFERLATPPSYRGIHILDQSKCIDCKLCAKACPVDCIEIEAVHHGRILEWQKFTIDYKKCIFCEFCIPPCPKDCIHMASEYEMATTDPSTMVEDLLTWTGLREVDRRGIVAAEAQRSVDRRVLRLLIAGLNVFPRDSVVELSTGQRAQVVAVRVLRADAPVAPGLAPPRGPRPATARPAG